MLNHNSRRSFIHLPFVNSKINGEGSMEMKLIKSTRNLNAVVWKRTTILMTLIELLKTRFNNSNNSDSGHCEGADEA